MEREFNLIDESWIRVMKPDKSIEEISLRKAFLSAHEYVSLAGETKTQDFCILRLMLAVMYTVFSRYNIDGEEIQLSDDDTDLRDTWADIWKTGSIPAKPIEKYFEKWYDRFWLFDEEYPFFQTVAVNGRGGVNSNSKMIGSLFESNNKPRIFADISKEGRILTYPESARWILHFNNFDDIAAKNPTPKKTWCCQLGLIALKGDNLFETIMLNYVADADIENEVFESKPLWEQKQSSEFNQLIAIPNNQAELLTLKSRSLYLCHENGLVNGYYLSGGDYFEEDDIPIEKMTIWKGYSEGKGKPVKMKPARHSPSRTAWQEFGSIAVFPNTINPEDDASKGQRTPGVIAWAIKNRKILGKDYMLKIETAAVVHDFTKATSLVVIDSISDSLTFHSQLLEELNIEWRTRINDVIARCEEAAKKVYSLSINLQKSSGASGDKLTGGEAKVQFYDLIDRPFRLWLASINPEENDISSQVGKIDTEIRDIAIKFGKELASQYGDNTIFGRYFKSDEKGKNKEITSSAQALNIYVATIRKIFGEGG